MLSAPGEVIHRLGWAEVQKTVFISELDRCPGSSLATHLAINDSGSNLINESRHELGVFVASRITCVLDVIRYVS